MFRVYPFLYRKQDQVTRAFITESQFPPLNGTPGTIMASSGFMAATAASSRTGTFLELKHDVSVRNVMQAIIVSIEVSLFFKKELFPLIRRNIMPPWVLLFF